MENDIPREFESIKGIINAGPIEPTAHVVKKEVDSKILEVEAIMQELEEEKIKSLEKANKILFQGKPRAINYDPPLHKPDAEPEPKRKPHLSTRVWLKVNRE